MRKFCVSFITYSLGCRTNQAELEEISDQLSINGLVHCHTPSLHPQPLSPNLVLINTCMVTQKAERETRKTIRHFRRLYPKINIVVLGCAVTAKDKFKIDLPEADLLISNGEKSNAVKKILTLMNGAIRHNMTHDRGLYCNKFNSNCSSYAESGRKFIKIQDGCSNCCSFCITTHLRGEPRSENPEKLINTINEFQLKADRPLVETDSKIKELILTGINIGLYGIDLKPQTDIWSLVDRILKETKIERLTLSTVYPEMLWDKGSDPVKGRTLMECIRNPRLTKCFHLALQSGSPTVLKQMNRPTDLKKLLNIVNQIRKIQPDFTFRADVIAGFPDETEEEHQETLDFIKKAKINFAHVFPYSPRVGTVAYEMIKNKKWQDLPMEVKRRRAEEIRLLVGSLSGELGRGLDGKTYKALIVKEIPCHSRFNRGSIQMNGDNYIDSGSTAGMTCFEGITENGLTVVINNQQSTISNVRGTIQRIRITGYENNYLTGTILSLPI